MTFPRSQRKTEELNLSFPSLRQATYPTGPSCFLLSLSVTSIYFVPFPISFGSYGITYLKDRSSTDFCACEKRYAKAMVKSTLSQRQTDRLVVHVRSVEGSHTAMARCQIIFASRSTDFIFF